MRGVDMISYDCFKFLELIIYIISTMTTIPIIILLLFLSGSLCEKHEALELDKPYEQSLDESTMFTGRYSFSISEENVKKMKGDKWFFFVEVEPNENNEWVSTSIQISVGKKDQQQSRNERICGTRSGGIDSCFFTNKQFDYKTEDIHANVRCRGPCKFKISAEVSEPYKLKVGEDVEMDFEKTAYSKVFQLDTRESGEFDQLRIVLRPNGYLQFPAPIGLYINKGTSLPSRKSHDFSSITLWDNGQGVFLDVPEAKDIFTILVEGPQKNVLVLQTELISFKDSYEIAQTLPHFDYVGEGTSKLFKCKVDPTKGLNIYFTTFSGSIRIKRILDTQLSEIDEQFPLLSHSFSQMQYQIPSSFFKDNQKYYKIAEYLIFQIQGVEESTFLFEYYPMSNQIEHLVPEVNRYVELPPKETNQYYIQLVQINSPEFKQTSIQIIVTHQPEKEVKLRFFKCEKEHGAKCQLKKSEIQSGKIDSEMGKEIKQTSKQTYEDIVIYKFTFPAKFFKKVKEDIKEYLLGVIVQNQADEERLYTIRYKNVGHNVYLKEMEVQKDRVSIDEDRYYLFTNRQSDIKEVRVHLMEISGRVKIQGFYEDPRTKDLEGQEVTDYHNMLKFNIKQNQTIFIKITGKEMAYFSLQVQPMKETEKEWWNRTHGDRGKFYNEISIFQGIPYEFTLEPNEKVVYQVHSKDEKFLLEMSSLLPLDLCMTEELSKPPFSPNCEVKEKLTKRELEQVRLERGKIGNIGVFNSNDKVNKFHIKFYTLQKKEGDPSGLPSDNYTTAKCFPAMLGKVTKQSMKKQTSTCFTSILAKAKDLELSFDLSSHDFSKINIVVALGDIQRLEILGGVRLFKENELQKSCKGLFPCPLKLFIDSEIDCEVSFTIQYVQGVIFLLDGIANQFSGATASRHFAYQLVNHINTTVVVENRKGSFNFYGSVVEANSFWSAKVAHPSSLEYQIKSTNPFYNNYQLAILTEATIKEAKCQECLLLITVEQASTPDHRDEKSSFTIECTQEDRLLKEKTPVASYLNKHSMAFYEFQNTVEGAVLISLNTQNRDCASMYVKKGESRATGADFDYQSHSNLLLIQNAEKAHYDITIEAKDNCYYSLDYTSASSKIYSTIQPGMYTDVRLDKQQEHSLFYHHTSPTGFRILTLHQQGEVVIHVKQYKTAKDYLQDKTTKKKYTWSGLDFIRIQKQDPHFCTDCYYQIALSGQRQTKTSVIIPTENTEFPIMMDSLINQELKKGETQKMRIYTDNIVEFEINVQYGSVNVSLQSQDNEKQFLFTKIYKANEKSQYETLNTTKGGETIYDYMSFTRVIIKAEEDTGFTFGLISDKDQTKRGNRVKYGIPEYVILEANLPECLIGRLDDNEQQFLVSITGDNQVDQMNNLEVSCKLQNGQLLELSKQVAKNEMMVKIDKPAKKVPSDYQFCFRSNQTIFITFIQSSRLLYLPQSTTVMVNGNMNFSFYSEGKSLLQINQCKSRAVTTVYHSFSIDDRVNSEIRQVRMTNNIIEFMYYGPVYVQMETKSSTIAWRKKDQVKKIGYGYDQYSPNRIRYTIQGNILKVDVYQLKKSESRAFDIPLKDTTYSVFLAEEEMNLYEAMNCESGIFLKETKNAQKNHNNEPKQDQLITSFEFDIEKVLAMFQHKKYILVGALANATSEIEGDGRYRFIYPFQEIPIPALKGDIVINPDERIEPIPKPIPEPQINQEKEEVSIVKILAIIVLVAFAVLVIYRVWMKKILKRRRLQRLSQQGGNNGEVRYQEFASYTS